MAEPVINLFEVGGGVAVAVRGGGDLLAWEAGQHRPAAGGEGQGLAERGGGHGLLHGGVLAGAGPRGWRQRWVSAWSWSARAGRMRAWYSAWAYSRTGDRTGCWYRTDQRLA